MSSRNSLNKRATGKYPWVIYAAGTSFLANLAGLLLYGSARGSDSLLGPASVIGAFFLFLSYAFSQLCWGYSLGRLCRRPASAWEAFFFGSLLFALLPSLAGFLPAIGPASFRIWDIFLLLGPILSLTQGRRPAAATENPLSLDRPSLVGALAAALCLIAFTGTFIPQPFWDSLWYHLTGTRLWFDHASFYLPETFPVAFKTGLWDYHFLWGHLLLGGREGTGLVAAHLFGQWASFAAFLASIAAVFSVRRIFGWSGISVWAGFLCTEIFMLASAAKNDWGAVFWGFSFLSFWARKESFWLIGLAAGAAFSAKYTEAFFLLPLLATVVWAEWKTPKAIATLSLSFLAAAAPLGVRNAVFTGNPFFPALSSLFTNPMGPSWKGISYYEGITFGLSTLAQKLRALLWENLTAPLAAFFFLGKGDRPARSLLMAAITSALLFLIFTGPKAEWRLAGCALILLSVFGFSTLENWLGIFPGAKRLTPWAILFLGAIISPLDWRAPVKLIFAPDPAVKIRESVAGAALAWARMNAAEGELAATLNEQRIYYFPPLPPIRAFDWPALDSELAMANSPEEAVEVFRRKKIRYLILSGEFLDRYYNKQICDWMLALSEAYPQAVPFRAPLSRVLDLSKLPAK